MPVVPDPTAKHAEAVGHDTPANCAFAGPGLTLWRMVHSADALDRAAIPSAGPVITATAASNRKPSKTASVEDQPVVLLRHRQVAYRAFLIYGDVDLAGGGR
ncbi:MAG: hypothetical protein ACLPVY_11070 [Acidimicrobiia bacterium]